MRRPSPAMLVALIALFIALGGPAQARRLLIDGSDIKKNTIRSAQIRDHTIGVRDISTVAVRELQVTPLNSVGNRELLDGAVTTGKLGGGAVTAGKLAASSVTAVSLADGSVTGAKIADGTLTTNEVARFSGRFRITVPPIDPQMCWDGEPVNLAPEAAGADISQDALLVTPLGANFDDKSLALTVRTSGASAPGRFVIALCNVGSLTPAGDTDVSFSYVIFDVP